MSLKGILIFFLIIIAIPIISKSQINHSQMWEFGIWGGGAYYIGDIRIAPQNVHRAIRPAAGVFNRINLNERLAIKNSLGYGAITAYDEWSGHEFDVARNLSFKSNIYELTSQFEFNFFKFVLGSERHRFSPYVFAGITVLHFNPKAEYEGEWYELQPLGTEGQQFSDFTRNEPYKLFAMAIPYGGGFKLNFSKNLSMGFEVGYRQAMTDYLDDISGTYVDPAIIGAGQDGLIAAALADRSGEVADEPFGVQGKQRGDDLNNDAYIMSVLSISYTFRKLKCPYPSGGWQ